MSTILFTQSIELGLMYTLLTLGVFISYRILDIPDLTVDGTFTLGAAVGTIITLQGHPIWAILAAFTAGILAGSVTAFLQTKLKIQDILAGILTMTGLYSINIMVMGNKANLSLLGSKTIFTVAKERLGNNGGIIIGLIVVICSGLLLYIFLHTRLGLSIRATGDNEAMVRSSSINVDRMKMIGLGLANGMVGISGALLAQKQAYVDISMGTGMVVIGIASLIIGGVIVDIYAKQRGIGLDIFSVIVGSVLYRLIISLALEINISATSMKLFSAIIVIVALSYPTVKDKIVFLCSPIGKDKVPTHKGE